MPHSLPQPSLRQWAALLGLTFAAAVYNTSEFLPTALLTAIQQDLGCTESRVGMVISAYAWVVTLFSLPLMVLASRFSMSRIMLWVIALFCLMQICTGLSPSYWALLASRLGVACSHALFWSIASPLAVRQMPPSHQAIALATISVGSSVAMVLGIPLGRTAGLLLGWRGAFLSLGALAGLALAALLWLMARAPRDTPFSFQEVPGLLKNRKLLPVFLVTILAITGYFCAQSYQDPFLEKAARMDKEAITLLFLLQGLASVAGGFLYPFFASRCPWLLRASVLGMGLPLVLMLPATRHTPSLVILCAILSLAYTIFNVDCQSEVVRHTRGSASAVAMSIFSALFNLGVAAGTLAGAGICTATGVAFTYLAGGLLTLASLFLLRKSSP
ncbi:MAG: MFS transporter [Oligosphaeraceae bacterium]